MRGLQLLTIVAVLVCLITGCVTAPHRTAPAPSNPDLGTVLERFYQQLEGGHWRYAHAMLSARYGALVSEDELRERYASFAFAEITVGQPHGMTVAVELTAPAHAGEAALAVRETLSLVWDGEDWKIDRITRRAIDDRSIR